MSKANWGGGATGALSGAEAGSMFGPWGAAIGGGLGGLMGLFGGGNRSNPADAANPYLNQISGIQHQYYDPYVKAGQGAMSTLQGQYGNLINDPTALMSQIGSKFQASPGYQYQLDQALGAGNRAAAAGGMLGTPAEQSAMQKNAMGLANQDYYNFMDRGMKDYQMGLGGLGDINQMGYEASTGLANNLSQALMSQANLAYSGAANQNQSSGGMFGGLLGMMGGGLPGLKSLFPQKQPTGGGGGYPMQFGNPGNAFQNYGY